VWTLALSYVYLWMTYFIVRVFVDDLFVDDLFMDDLFVDDLFYLHHVRKFRLRLTVHLVRTSKQIKNSRLTSHSYQLIITQYYSTIQSDVTE